MTDMTRMVRAPPDAHYRLPTCPGGFFMLNHPSLINLTTKMEVI